MLPGIHFEDLYMECMTCWFRVCLSCSSLHRHHFLQRVKPIRKWQDMPELSTSATCACCSGRVRLGMHCTRCDFAMCLECRLAATDDFEFLRAKTAQLLIDHGMKHTKYSSMVPLIIYVSGLLFFLRKLPPVGGGCRCLNDPDVVNHCGTCYIRKPFPFLPLGLPLESPNPSQ